MALILEKLKVALEKTEAIFEWVNQDNEEWRHASILVTTCLNLIPTTKDCFGKRQTKFMLETQP